MAGALSYRMVQLQVTAPDEFVTFGESQRVHVIELPGRRGDLLDRNGEQLAISIPQRTIWADPRLVLDPQTTASQLAPVLDADQGFLLERLTTQAAFVYLSRQVDDEIADAVVEMDLDGVFTLEEPRRFNPSGTALANGTLGIVGVDHVGLSGVELQYDDLLAGVPGEVQLETAPDGSTIATGRLSETPAESGADLTLSLDRPLQFEVERMLANQVANMGAKSGVVVVMKPATGEVLAMATVARDEDLNVVQASENRAVTWAFEPGSIMKPLTFAAVLEEGVATPDSARAVPYTYQLYDSEFSDSSPHATQTWSVTDILVKSSNIGTMMWAMDLGGETLDQYFQDFGFGTETPLGAVGESSGVMIDYEEWSGTSIATIPIGQGISVTPLQMLTAFNTIANGGVYVPPQLVVGATDGDGDQIELESGSNRRVFSEETASELQTILAGVVDRGTGQNAAVPGYTVAGKTGTAWIPQPNGGYTDAGGYYHYNASFAGFLPADAPEISILVSIDEPTAQVYGGYAAAPLFSQIAEYAMRRFQIPPTGEILLGAEPTATPEEAEVDQPLVRGLVAEVPELAPADAEAGSVPADDDEGSVPVDETVPESGDG